MNKPTNTINARQMAERARKQQEGCYIALYLRRCAFEAVGRTEDAEKLTSILRKIGYECGFSLNEIRSLELQARQTRSAIVSWITGELFPPPIAKQ